MPEQLARAKNAAYLRRWGVPIIRATLYAAHFLGAVTAGSILAADKAARADLIASDGRQMPIPQFCVTRRLPNSSNGCAARPQDRGGGAMRRRAVIVIPILLALAGYAHNLASCNNACAVALLAMSAMACVCPMIDPGSRQPVRMCGAGRDQLPGIMPACFGQMRV